MGKQSEWKQHSAVSMAQGGGSRGNRTVSAAPGRDSSGVTVAAGSQAGKKTGKQSAWRKRQDIESGKTSFFSDYDALVKDYNTSLDSTNAYLSGGWKKAEEGRKYTETYAQLMNRQKNLSDELEEYGDSYRKAYGQDAYEKMRAALTEFGTGVDGAMNSISRAADVYGAYGSQEEYEQAARQAEREKARETYTQLSADVQKRQRMGMAVDPETQSRLAEAFNKMNEPEPSLSAEELRRRIAQLEERQKEQEDKLKGSGKTEEQVIPGIRQSIEGRHRRL